MNFNPAAMLPGAAPPKKVDTDTAVSFDEPVVTKTLDTVTKVGYNCQPSGSFSIEHIQDIFLGHFLFFSSLILDIEVSRCRFKLSI